MSSHPVESVRAEAIERPAVELAEAVPPRSPGSLRRLHGEVVADLFDKDGLSEVFAHARNVITCTMIMAAGLYAVRHQDRVWLPGMWTVHAAGYAVAVIGALLLFFNLADGLRKLSRRRHSALLRALAILVYVMFSLRLTQVFLYFRAGP
jgi:hypothetical protein